MKYISSPKTQFNRNNKSELSQSPRYLLRKLSNRRALNFPVSACLENINFILEEAKLRLKSLWPRSEATFSFVQRPENSALWTYTYVYVPVEM